MPNVANGCLQLRKQVKSSGYRAERWSRWCDGKKAGESWPASDKVAGCIVKAPISAESFNMSLHAAASVLDEGSPIWIYGHSIERSVVARHLKSELFSGFRPIDSKLDKGFAVSCCRQWWDVGSGPVWGRGWGTCGHQRLLRCLTLQPTPPSLSPVALCA